MIKVDKSYKTFQSALTRISTQLKKKTFNSSVHNQTGIHYDAGLVNKAESFQAASMFQRIAADTLKGIEEARIAFEAINNKAYRNPLYLLNAMNIEINDFSKLFSFLELFPTQEDYSTITNWLFQKRKQDSPFLIEGTEVGTYKQYNSLVFQAYLQNPLAYKTLRVLEPLEINHSQNDGDAPLQTSLKLVRLNQDKPEISMRYKLCGEDFVQAVHWILNDSGYIRVEDTNETSLSSYMKFSGIVSPSSAFVFIDSLFREPFQGGFAVNYGEVNNTIPIKSVLDFPLPLRWALANRLGIGLTTQQENLAA